MLPGRHTTDASVPPPAFNHNPRPSKEIAKSTLKLELVPGQTARLCTPIMQIHAKAGAAQNRKKEREKETKAKIKGNVGRLEEVMENLPQSLKTDVVHPRVVQKIKSHASTT